MSISNTAYNSIGRAQFDDNCWVTPDPVFQFASDKWGAFDLDAAATSQNSKCDNWIDPQSDALSPSAWTGRVVWLNPPYGRIMPRFIERALKEVREGSVERVVCLIASRTDTRIFQNVIFPNASHIHFIKGRISFSNGKKSGPANFASCFVVFDKDNKGEGVKITYGAID